MICQKPNCPCLCDNPDLHHRLAAQGGSEEVNPDFCAGLRKTDQLVEECDRLRALIKQAERGDRGDGYLWKCPWCGAVLGGDIGPTTEPHIDDCPAFTPDGTVR